MAFRCIEKTCSVIVSQRFRTGSFSLFTLFTEKVKANVLTFSFVDLLRETNKWSVILICLCRHTVYSSMCRCIHIQILVLEVGEGLLNLRLTDTRTATGPALAGWLALHCHWHSDSVILCLWLCVWGSLRQRHCVSVIELFSETVTSVSLNSSTRVSSFIFLHFCWFYF